MRTCGGWACHGNPTEVFHFFIDLHPEHLQVAGAMQDAKNIWVKNTTCASIDSAGLRNRSEVLIFSLSF